MAKEPTNGKEDTKPGKPQQSDYVQQLLKEQAQLQAEKSAIIEEFTKQIAEKGDAFDEDDIKDKIKEVLPEAFATLKSLLASSESDTVRATLVKYVFDAALLVLKKDKADSGEEVPETVGDLIDQLKKND